MQIERDGGRSESDRGGDEVYSAIFGDKEKNELKLDDDAVPVINIVKNFPQNIGYQWFWFFFITILLFQESDGGATLKTNPD